VLEHSERQIVTDFTDTTDPTPHQPYFILCAQIFCIFYVFVRYALLPSVFLAGRWPDAGRTLAGRWPDAGRILAGRWLEDGRQFKQKV
jgi:hypothetical protein